jgi:hypothetical protein
MFGVYEKPIKSRRRHNLYCKCITQGDAGAYGWLTVFQEFFESVPGRTAHFDQSAFLVTLCATIKPTIGPKLFQTFDAAET